MFRRSACIGFEQPAEALGATHRPDRLDADHRVGEIAGELPHLRAVRRAAMRLLCTSLPNEKNIRKPMISASIASFQEIKRGHGRNSDACRA